MFCIYPNIFIQMISENIYNFCSIDRLHQMSDLIISSCKSCEQTSWCARSFWERMSFKVWKMILLFFSFGLHAVKGNRSLCFTLKSNHWSKCYFKTRLWTIYFKDIFIYKIEIKLTNKIGNMNNYKLSKIYLCKYTLKSEFLYNF